ncbi:MFS transporter [Longispora albida]|uniref:MFS transporter n=1 Tax=Longispora albida TaxID=203523 RepID=UPI000378C2B4|nr:MFS transporter [Longispora albida]
MRSQTSLYRHRDFRQLWAADTVSQAGTAVTLVALPLVAISVLHATPAQAGLLVACEYLAFLLLGLPAGAWADRYRPRRIMLAGDLGRAVLLGSVPAAAAFGVLSLPQLYAVAFGMSVCTVFFDVAYGGYLPRLVPAEQLTDGNVKLEVTRTIAQVGGPGIGGLLISALTAPFAVLVDALSYLGSAALLARIRTPGQPGTREPGGSLRAEIGAGLRFVFGHRQLRGITLTAALSNLFGTIGFSLLLVLLAGELRLPPVLCGLVFTAEAAGGLIGALLTRRIVARIGERLALSVPVAVSAVLWLLAVPMFQADWRLAVAFVLHGLGWVVFMTFRISSVSYRQRLCPPELLGRMTATVRFVVWGAMPAGAVIGGLLGQWLGVRPALWIGAAGELFAVLPVFLALTAGRRGADAAPVLPRSDNS